MSAAAIILAPGQYLRVLTSALEGLQQRWEGSEPTSHEVRAEIEALALLAYQGQEATGDAIEASAPPNSGAMLPDKARNQLGVLVTELNGLATVLRTDITVVDHNNVYSAVAEWADRIAHDLGEMECRSYPAKATETAR